MNELFLSYLWKYRHLDQEIKTESGEQLVVLHPGEQNTDSGPDFFNARIRIGDTTWAGNVEIHVVASDWFRHGHHDDPAYDHAILHVVYDADRQVFHQNGEPMQTLVVKNQFPAWIYDRYQLMMQNRQWIPCLNQLHSSGSGDFGMWAPALAVERLQNKSINIRQLLSGCSGDWEEACYRHLSGSFGFKINTLPFELLAKSLPLKVVRHHCDSMFQMEALLFGQAGMLNQAFRDPYPRNLTHEYQFLCSKYNLKPIAGSLWKHLRLRPPNFPAIRISQFAGFLCQTQARLFNLFEKGTLTGVMDDFIISASAYWDSHYLFDKSAVRQRKIMGGSCVKLFEINGMAPFLFYYGLEKGQPDLCERVIEFLEQTSGEQNVHITRWRQAGFPVGNAMQTQALLQLKQSYCDKKRCLECRIGNRLLTEPG